MTDVYNLRETRKYTGYNKAHPGHDLSKWMQANGWRVTNKNRMYTVEARKKGAHVNFRPEFKATFTTASDGSMTITIHSYATIKVVTGTVVGVLTGGISAAVGVGTFAVHASGAEAFLRQVWIFIESHAASPPEVLQQVGFKHLVPKQMDNPTQSSPSPQPARPSQPYPNQSYGQQPGQYAHHAQPTYPTQSYGRQPGQPLHSPQPVHRAYPAQQYPPQQAYGQPQPHQSPQPTHQAYPAQHYPPQQAYAQQPHQQTQSHQPEQHSVQYSSDHSQSPVQYRANYAPPAQQPLQHYGSQEHLSQTTSQYTAQAPTNATASPPALDARKQEIQKTIATKQAELNDLEKRAAQIRVEIATLNVELLNVRE